MQVEDGTLSLSNVNTFTGTAAISSGTLALTGVGSVSDANDLFIGAFGTFDITGINSSTTIQDLNGSTGAKILLGNKELIITLSNPDTYSGTISGLGGSLQVVGSSSLILAGLSSYTGPTTVGSDAALLAGVAGAFAPLSDFTVDGTLDLLGHNSTVNSLSGTSTGLVQSSTGSTTILSVSNGGNFAGSLQNVGGILGINLAGGTLSLTGDSNTYSGSTTIANTATLSAGVAGALSANSAHTVNGTLLLNNFGDSIKSLAGVGTINTGGTTGILTVNSGSSGTVATTFSGGITGAGGLTLHLAATDLTLSTTIGANTYTGLTTLNDATLNAGAANALSPFSPLVLNNGVLNLNTYNNTIYSLTGDSDSLIDLGTGILTINGGASTIFTGSMQNLCGGLTISGGSTQTLSGTSTYCGPTLIEDGTLIIDANGALSPNTAVTIGGVGILELLSPATANSAVSIANSGLMTTQEPVSLSTTYSQTPSGTLEIFFNSSTHPTDGYIQATTGITLAGTLEVV